jgi:hypothetical protein
MLHMLLTKSSNFHIDKIIIEAKFRLCHKKSLLLAKLLVCCMVRLLHHFSNLLHSKDIVYAGRYLQNYSVFQVYFLVSLDLVTKI